MALKLTSCNKEEEKNKKKQKQKTKNKKNNVFWKPLTLSELTISGRYCNNNTTTTNDYNDNNNANKVNIR